ncbi:Tetraspanin-6 [Raphanus sativus]|uniref:Tetraspanin-6-like n=1 Tax=Raphanus sativus TaxID=3726 RepID=A0A9W3CVC3_RAPSA|nr:tetraspanin-6-like [Raphanus sativus]KAJ4868646.1 Tetraspanin-6 [Raphanus sativus]
MYRFSNTVIGVLNLLSLLASIPIIGTALWKARSSTTCENFLQTPLLVIGFVILLVSLAGFIGACFHVAWALWVYLVVMIFLIATLMGLTLFGLVVTSQGGGVEVPGRVYKEYRLGDYHPWLRERVRDQEYWNSIRSCILTSKTCSKIQSWTTLDYFQRDMTSVQSGCCKPPTACTYETGVIVGGEDCYRWNNGIETLCYECDACKAGVLEEIRLDWRKLSVVNILVLVLLIAVYAAGCCAFHNTRHAAHPYHPSDDNRMTKVRPRWDYYWWRWWHEKKEQLY